MRLSKRLTYANVMSSIAVFLVLGGATAVAATQLGKNSVGTKQLKANAVTGAKIKNGVVTGSKIKDGAVSGAKINLGTLGTVPSAANASTVNGENVTKVFAKIPKGSTATVATFGVFEIVATCQPAGTFGAFELDPQATDVDVVAFGRGEAASFFERNQGVEPNAISLRGTGVDEVPRGIVTFSAAQTGGFTATGTLAFNDSPVFNKEGACVVYGQVVWV